MAIILRIPPFRLIDSVKIFRKFNFNYRYFYSIEFAKLIIRYQMMSFSSNLRFLLLVQCKKKCHLELLRCFDRVKSTLSEMEVLACLNDVIFPFISDHTFTI